jgi:hypothetical protein
MKVKLIYIKPYTKELMAALFSNGQWAFFAKKDLDYELLEALERVQNRLEPVKGA